MLLDGCCPPVTAGEAWQSSTENISAWIVLAMATLDVLYARISDDEFGMATGIDRLRVDANSPSVNADGSEGFWDVEEAVWVFCCAHPQGHLAQQRAALRSGADTPHACIRPPTD